jgi:prepilin peptidase CpaA
MNSDTLWLLVVLVAVWAGVMDWRYRRIPNWLTVTGAVAGLVVNTVLTGWAGTKASLLGTALGLLLLFPFVMLRAIGAGDWKLIGMLGAFLGPSRLLTVLAGSVLVAGIMAVVLIIVKGRVRETLRNITHMMGALLSLRMPPPAVSLDNPDSAKVPFGVAVAVTAVLLSAGHFWGRLA